MMPLSVRPLSTVQQLLDVKRKFSIWRNAGLCQASATVESVQQSHVTFFSLSAFWIDSIKRESKTVADNSSRGIVINLMVATLNFSASNVVIISPWRECTLLQHMWQKMCQQNREVCIVGCLIRDWPIAKVVNHCSTRVVDRLLLIASMSAWEYHHLTRVQAAKTVA